MDDKKEMAIVTSKSLVCVISVNTEAWDKVAESFKQWGKVFDTSMESIRPALEECAEKQREAWLKFREELLGEWQLPDTYFYAGGTSCGLTAAMEEIQRRKNAEIFNASAKLLSTELPFEAPYLEEDLDGSFLDLVERIEQEKIKQKQLHKKKGKTVKNWQADKFWQRKVK